MQFNYYKTVDDKECSCETPNYLVPFVLPFDTVTGFCNNCKRNKSFLKKDINEGKLKVQHRYDAGWRCSSETI